MSTPVQSSANSTHASLSAEQRLLIDQLVAARIHGLLWQHAARARAEYRLMDLMDRHVVGLAASLALVAALYLGMAELFVRGLAHFGVAVERVAIALAWVGLLLSLPAYLAWRVRVLYQRSLCG